MTVSLCYNWWCVGFRHRAWGFWWTGLNFFVPRLLAVPPPHCSLSSVCCLAAAVHPMWVGSQPGGHHHATVPTYLIFWRIRAAGQTFAPLLFYFLSLVPASTSMMLRSFWISCWRVFGCRDCGKAGIANCRRSFAVMFFLWKRVLKLCALFKVIKFLHNVCNNIIACLVYTRWYSSFISGESLMFLVEPW